MNRGRSCSRSSLMHTRRLDASILSHEDHLNMTEAKTKRTEQRVGAFIEGLGDERRRKDCSTLVKLMTKAAGAKGAMYGASIVGFGTQTVTYADGRTAEWPVVAFSPRKADLTLYVGARRAP